jgi:hypothetical protein
LKGKECLFVDDQFALSLDPPFRNELGTGWKVTIVTLDDVLWNNNDCVSWNPHLVDLETIWGCLPGLTARDSGFKTIGFIDHSLEVGKTAECLVGKVHQVARLRECLVKLGL